MQDALQSSQSKTHNKFEFGAKNNRNSFFIDHTTDFMIIFETSVSYRGRRKIQ